MKKAITIGINQYQNSPLNGCVNDSQLFKNIFEQNGFAVEQLLDGYATKKRVLKLLNWLSDANEIAIHFSGHGTRIRLSDNKFYEAMVLVDDLLTDAELIEFCNNNQIPSTIILDCCHSGGMGTRSKSVDAKPRYLDVTNMAHTCKPVARQQLDEVILYGCNDDEYSYDAWFDGKPYGALSYYFNKSYHKDLKVGEVFNKINKHLPSRKYHQTPSIIFLPKYKDNNMFNLSQEPKNFVEVIEAGSLLIKVILFIKKLLGK